MNGKIIGDYEDSVLMDLEERDKGICYPLKIKKAVGIINRRLFYFTFKFSAGIFLYLLIYWEISMEEFDSKYSAPKLCIISSMGMTFFPSSVNPYSTLGGTTG